MYAPSLCFVVAGIIAQNGEKVQMKGKTFASIVRAKGRLRHIGRFRFVDSPVKAFGWVPPAGSFGLKPCRDFRLGIPPGAPFLSRQERGKECGLRELAAGQRPLEAASYRFSCRSKKTAAGGTQPKYGQGFRMKCFCFRAANCLAVPPKSLYRPSSVTALWAVTASPRGSHFTGRR